MRRLKVDTKSAPRPWDKKSTMRSSTASSPKKPKFKVTQAKEGVLVDYGRFVVQRHHPLDIEQIPEKQEFIEEKVKSAKKENLRKSLEKYEEFLDSAKKEYPYSPPIKTKSAQKSTQQPEICASQPPKLQIGEIKEELAKLSQDFAGCKKIVSESLSEVKNIMEKLKEKIPESIHKEKKPETEELPKGSDDSFVKIKPHEINEENVIITSEEPTDLIVNQETRKTNTEEIKIPSAKEAENQAPPKEPQISIEQPKNEQLPPEPKVQEPFLITEIPMKEDVHEAKEPELPKKESGQDENLLKTDEFILEKFKKVEQVKDLLKTLHP